MSESYSASYAAAGVDIEAGYKGVQLMKQHVARTMIPGVVSDLGGFGGLFAPDLAGMKEPVLVSGTDGVGTKLRVAQLLDQHDTIGIDCVAMCVNDIVCCGAKPLFFLDYIAIGKNEPEKVAAIVSGVAEGCVRSGCALIGGETAEHPGVMDPDDYDIAGFAVGIVDREKIIDGSRVWEGDVLIGLTSSGVHSNGFSLVRKVFDIEYTDLTAPMDELDGKSLGEILLAPTKIYVKAVQALLEGGVDLAGGDHVDPHVLLPHDLIDALTGKGLAGVEGTGLLPKVLAEGCSVNLAFSADSVLVHQIQGCAVLFGQLHRILPGEE